MASIITATEASTLPSRLVAEPQSIVPTHGLFRYISSGITPTASPHLYHLPPLAEFGDVRSLPVTDIKFSTSLGENSPYTLDSHGFTARHHPSQLHSAPYSRPSWNDETLLKSIYVPEVESMVKQLTGAKQVVTEMVLVRSQVHNEVDALAKSEKKESKVSGIRLDELWPKMIGTSVGGGASPAPKVHLDFSAKGARTHLRKFHTNLAEAGKDVLATEDELLSSGVTEEDLPSKYDGPRWAMYSIWRPLKRVRRDPLAFADRCSFPRSDYIPVALMMPTGKALQKNGMEAHAEETYLAYGSADHKWCWVWDMEPEEVVCIQLFDSEAEKNGYCGVMHSSVVVPGTENEPARESIEVRCTAIW